MRTISSKEYISIELSWLIIERLKVSSLNPKFSSQLNSEESEPFNFLLTIAVKIGFPEILISKGAAINAIDIIYLNRKLLFLINII